VAIAPAAQGVRAFGSSTGTSAELTPVICSADYVFPVDQFGPLALIRVAGPNVAIGQDIEGLPIGFHVAASGVGILTPRSVGHVACTGTTGFLPHPDQTVIFKDVPCLYEPHVRVAPQFDVWVGEGTLIVTKNGRVAMVCANLTHQLFD
jgi:hypothetical protein